MKSQNGQRKPGDIFLERLRVIIFPKSYQAANTKPIHPGHELKMEISIPISEIQPGANPHYYGGKQNNKHKDCKSSYFFYKKQDQGPK
jgi:hypothetical protein